MASTGARASIIQSFESLEVICDHKPDRNFIIEIHILTSSTLSLLTEAGPARLVKFMCIYLVKVRVKVLSDLWSQITYGDSNDLIIEALTPIDAIVNDSGAFGGVCGARGGAYHFWPPLVSPDAEAATE